MWGDGNQKKTGICMWNSPWLVLCSSVLISAKLALFYVNIKSWFGMQMKAKCDRFAKDWKPMCDSTHTAMLTFVLDAQIVLKEWGYSCPLTLMGCSCFGLRLFSLDSLVSSCRRCGGSVWVMVCVCAVLDSQRVQKVRAPGNHLSLIRDRWQLIWMEGWWRGGCNIQKNSRSPLLRNTYLNSDPLRLIGFAPLPDTKVEPWKAATKHSSI